MTRLDRQLLCDICGEAVAYTGEEKRFWEEITRWFEQLHDHRDPQLRRAD